MNDVLVNGHIPTVRDDVANSRYVVEANGEQLGLIDYRLNGAELSLIHTEVDQDKSVPGLARLLVDGALADARSRQLGVLPVCPYVRRVIDRNRDDYLDLVPEHQRARFELT